MDKTRIMDGKNTRRGCDVHRMPKGMREIHRKYGLWILSFGSNEAPPDGFSRTRPRYFEFFSISHLRSGRGRCWLAPDFERDMNPGDCVIVAPQQVNRYGGSHGEPYVEDSLCFAGPVADMLWRAGVLKSGVFHLGLARRLLPIQKLAFDPSDNAQVNANIALQKLIVDIHNEALNARKRSDSRYSALERLLSEIRVTFDKWWTVEEMAEYCSLSDDQFRRVFKKRTGMLPKTYIDRIKLGKAAEMLISTNKSVEEIALELAYVDPYHFSRRFKKMMGFSPTCYRREFSPASGRES